MGIGWRGEGGTMKRWSETAAKLVRYMERNHVGEAAAATAEELVDYLGLASDRDLRDVRAYAVEVLRVPIVATFSGGYCIAAGYHDDAYHHCISQRRAVARRQFARVEAIERAMVERYGEPRLFEGVGG